MRSIPCDIDETVQTAHALADAARGAILPYFRDPALQTDDKGSDSPGHVFDPVTAADRAAERAMRDILSVRRPEDGVLGEEFGEKASKSGLTWVLDPIDGTRGFMSGTPTWGVLIALSDAQGPVYGLIDQPYIGERFEGGLGRAEMTGPLGTTPLRTRGARPLGEAILFTTFPELDTPKDAEGFAAVSAEARLTRYGMDCYAYALLAAG
ncbi:MAG: inositol monophosphatase family protein, partial [Pseudomonadota bacterium]